MRDEFPFDDEPLATRELLFLSFGAQKRGKKSVVSAF